MRLEKDTFGPVLRAARERRGVTLKQLALETKLSVELWEGLEENDLSRWPKRVFARSYVRDYALRVGLDADDVVNEFCRLFPEWGDRRAERVIREKAEIIAHDLSWEDLPAAQPRRASDRPRSARQDSSAAIMCASSRSRSISLRWSASGFSDGSPGFSYWPSAAIAPMSYSVLATSFDRTQLWPRRLRVGHPHAEIDSRDPAPRILARRNRLNLISSRSLLAASR